MSGIKAATSFAALALAVSFAQAHPQVRVTDAHESPTAADLVSEAAIGPPELVVFEESDTPFPLTPAQLQLQALAMERKEHQHNPETPTGQTPPVGPQGGETFANPSPAPNTFTVFKDVSVVPGGASRSAITEPSHAAAGKFVFYTGNWFAARSTNGGDTWSYINPYADMSDFCCDQEVIYDRSRDMFIWYRQGVADGSGRGRIRIGVSTDGAATWCMYDLYPDGVNGSWTNQSFDYPHVALTTNRFYFATNIYDVNDFWQRSVIISWPMDSMRVCAGFGYNYVDRNDTFNFTPVQGAPTTMYWGSHIDTDSLRVFTWVQGSGSYSWNDVDIAAWSSTGRGSAHCPSPDGTDACQRFDSRITGGWVTAGQIGFFWDVREGAGFAYPYTESALFSQATKAYVGRPYVFSGSYAWIYGYAATEDRGYLGIGVWQAGGGNYPNLYVGIDDDFNGIPPGWEVALIEASNDGPNGNVWGDYLRIRPLSGCDRLWTVSGQVLQGGGSGSNSSPRYAVFGRQRESGCYTRWFNK